MLIQKYYPAPPFCLQTAPVPQQVNPFLPHSSLPLWHRQRGEYGLTVQQGRTSPWIFELPNVQTKLSKPDLQASVFTPIWRDRTCSKGVIMTQYRGGGQKAKRKDLVSGNPQKLTACFLSPTLAITFRACWHKALSKPALSSQKFSALPRCSFQWVWALEPVLCSLISEWGLALLSSFDRPPGALPLSFVSCQNGSVPAHPFAITLARWPSLCFSAGLHSSAVLWWLQSAGISSRALLWTRLCCLMHRPAADPASPCLPGGARKPWRNTAIQQSLWKDTANELLEQERVRAPCNSQSGAWRWSAL